MEASAVLDCFVSFDPEADVATLSFTSERKTGGSALEIPNRAGLAGLLRLGPDGEFSHLEVLGATRALPHYVPRLTAPFEGVRGYHRGVFAVSVSRLDDPIAVVINFADTATAGPQHTIPVTARDSAALVAAIQRDNAGALRSLTLYDSGALLTSFLNLSNPTLQ